MTIVNVRAAFSIATVVLVGATALFGATTAVAPVEDSATVPATASVGPSDPKELEAFIDGMMAAHLPSRKIPAATIAIVKDGELFFAKGYGLADREKKIPVDAEKTLFRPGSTSKLFTWTAVMQLVERGEIDLDADVNSYLKSFKIPATYPEPITMKHLLTHTAGFEDASVGFLIIKEESGLMPMREALAAHIPARVRPPGTWSSYSNYGTALAGLVIEDITGMPFAEYVERNIFQPLGMERSSFREPLPENLAPDMAVGYRRKAGLYEPGYFELISNFGPAGALSSTATDMARFMIAHLQLGRYGDQRILQESTARQMQSRLYAPDPRLPGMAHGFYESEVCGQHLIGHGGDTIFFHSDLALLTEHNVGLFVSYVNEGGLARIELVEAFVKRYFPCEEPQLPEPPADFAERGKKYAGKYRFTRHNWSSLEKLMTLPSVVTAAVTPKGTLMTSGVLEDPWYWVEVEPGFFRQIDGGMTLAFTENPEGRVTHMSFSMLPFMPTYRIAWYTDPIFNYVLVVLAVVLCLTTLVSAFRHRKARKLDPRGARWAVRLAALTSALTLIFLIAVTIIVSAAGEELFSGYPPTLTAALMLPILTSILTVGVAVFAVLVWKGKYWTRFRRVHYTLFALAAIGLVWFYWFWNILGVQYG